MRRMILGFLLVLCTMAVSAQVDTISIYSAAMRQARKCVVVQPRYKGAKKHRFPVVYLLHGYSGGYSDWARRVPQLQEWANTYRVLIVCPDGGYSSWYFDAPLDTASKFETYIGTEVPDYIDAHYRTIRDRRARAITGLSMGGHGALFLAFRHADRFGACGSMSGGVDLNASRSKYDIAKRIGDTVRYAENWKTYSVMGVVEQAPKDSLAIVIDCGTSDFFFPANRQLHEKLLRLKIAHDYTERPGGHTWDYWRNALPYHLLFFRKTFDRGDQ